VKVNVWGARFFASVLKNGAAVRALEAINTQRNNFVLDTQRHAADRGDPAELLSQSQRFQHDRHCLHIPSSLLRACRARSNVTRKCGSGHRPRAGLCPSANAPRMELRMKVTFVPERPSKSKPSVGSAIAVEPAPNNASCFRRTDALGTFYLSSGTEIPGANSGAEAVLRSWPPQP
jgi:hypothetical protein